jgi:hypothetical protein
MYKQLLSIVGLSTLSLLSEASAVALAPQVAGNYLNGNGANSQWVQVYARASEESGGPDGWRGSTQGSQAWGTGIWSLADAGQVMSLSAGDPYVLKTFSGVASQISYSNQAYLNQWGATWGTQNLAPIFTNAAGENQENFASHFTGYISITDPGMYNFGVMYDDGFNFTLTGAGGSSLSISQDGLNPRDRLGFGQDLSLTSGLYSFDLLAYNRLEVGVVNLSWTQNGGDWVTIPQDHLFTTTPVPEPEALSFMLAGLGVVAWATRRKLKPVA